MYKPIRLLMILILVCLVWGCRPQTVVVTVTVPVPASSPGTPTAVAASKPAEQDRPPPLSFGPEAAPLPTQAEYDAALLEASRAEGERRYEAALAALEKAKTLQDTPTVRQEIDRLRAVQARQAAAAATTRDIQALVERGQIEQADQLLIKALREYGGTDEAEPLLRLKRQTDALLAAQARDAAARREKLRQDAENALRESNYRAALLVLDQLLATGDDPAVRQKRDEIQTRLARYDTARERGLTLQRDPQQLEVALAQFQEAAQAWDTPQIRQDINRCQVALQARRERLGVADFELRSDLGLPLLGRTLADEMLPAFRGRFDLVERGQLAAVVRELKIEQSLLASDPQARADLGRLANLRYLVVGSITPVSGITVHARLVDVRTGLIVQTAKLVTATPEEALRRAPELARLLLMSDQEQLAWEQQQWQQGPPPPVVVGALPPPPVFQPSAAPPPPLVVWSPRPPEFGGFSFQQVVSLPEQPASGVNVGVAVNRTFRDRLVAVQLELGDNLFRRGRFREAHQHYQVALNLAPQHTDILVRINNCQPYLPPPVVVFPAPPRAAIVNFQVGGDPRVLPPPLGGWLAEQIAPYFSPPLEIVDRGQLYWYMGRLGLTVQDLVFNLEARLWLGRALGLRYLILGAVQMLPDGRISLLTVMVDTEFGTLAGRGEIILLSPAEIKLCLGQLASLTLLPAPERLMRQQQLVTEQQMFLEAQQALHQQRFSVAIDILGRLRKNAPLDIRFAVELQRAEELQRQFAFEQARQQEMLRQQALAAEQARRQAELALAAEQARILAMRQAPPPVFIQQRQVAQEQLITQARIALRGKNFTLGIQLFESAVAMGPADSLIEELAAARAQWALEERLQAERLALEQEARRRQQREQERLAAQAQLEAARRAREEAERARLEAQARADQAAYTRLLDDAQRHAAQNNWDAAVSMLQTARQLRRTEEVERLLQNALMEQAKATVKKEDAAKLAALEKKLAEEKERRRQAEEEAQRNWKLYEEALAAAQNALQQQQYPVALAKFEEAGKLYRTEAVAAGLQTVQLKLKEQAEAEAKSKAQAEAQRRRDREFQQLLAAAQQAEGKKDWSAALAAATKALALRPDSVEAQAVQSRARLEQEKAEAQARLQQAEADKNARIKELLGLAQQHAAAKQFDAAELYVKQAATLRPGDAQVAAFKQRLDAARQAEAEAKAAAAARAKLEAERRAQASRATAPTVPAVTELERLLTEGRAALTAAKLEQAEELLAQALRLEPTDPRVGQFQRAVQQARRKAREEQAQAAAAAKAKAEQEAQAKREKFQTAINAGRKAMQDEDFTEAVHHFKAAVALFPSDSTAQMLLGMAEKKLASAAAAAERKAKEEEAARQAEKEAERRQQQEQERQRADAEAKARAEMAQRQAAFNQAMARGNSLLVAKKFEEAVKAYEEALRLMPDHAEAQQRLSVAKKAAANAQAEAQVKARVAKLIADAQAAYQARQYEAAKAALEEVLQLQPGHPTAVAGLQTIQRAQSTPTTPTRPAPPPTRPTPVPSAPTQPVPTQPVATRPVPAPTPTRFMPTRPGPLPTRPLPPAMRPGPTPSAPTTTRPTPPADPRLEYARQMQLGAALEKQRQWPEALAAYREALKLLPGDTAAQSAVRRVEFRQHLENGQKLLAEKKFAEAATAFEEALKLAPNHPEALRLLKQAKEGK